MRAFSLHHLSDHELLESLTREARMERNATAMLVALIAEVDRRRLYAPAGFPSMHSYCVGALGLSEAAAFKRIRAARAERRFPGICEALADGRLHLTAVVMVWNHLNQENFKGLLKAAEFKTKREIELLLAERFPQPDVPFRMRALPTPTIKVQRTAHPAIDLDDQSSGQCSKLSPETVSFAAQCESSTQHNVTPARVTPLAPRRFALQVTVDQDFHELLEEARTLLSHALPTGDVAEVLRRGLKELVARLRKRKFAEIKREAKLMWREARQ